MRSETASTTLAGATLCARRREMRLVLRNLAGGEFVFVAYTFVLKHNLKRVELVAKHSVTLAESYTFVAAPPAVHLDDVISSPPAVTQMGLDDYTDTSAASVYASYQHQLFLRRQVRETNKTVCLNSFGKGTVVTERHKMFLHQNCSTSRGARFAKWYKGSWNMFPAAVQPFCVILYHPMSSCIILCRLLLPCVILCGACLSLERVCG